MRAGSIACGLVGVVAMLAAVPASGAAPTPSPVGSNDGPVFTPLGGGVRSSYVPLGADPSAWVTVTIELDAPPVAEVVPEGASPAVEASVRSVVVTQQNPVVQAVSAAGGTVLYRLEDALSAVVARVPRRAVAGLRELHHVRSVSPSRRLSLDNSAANALSGAAAAWTDAGVTGAGVKIAIIDDGIDYTHAMFGGSGDPAAYEADDRTIVEPGSFPTAKVVGGYDFVGDAYDAESEDAAVAVPLPDDDPMACGVHGTHVAGTAAGAGVTADGATFAGPYTADSVADLATGPGSAPEALLYAYKVFGCDGSVEEAIVAAAVDRAVADGVDVINLSLGGPYGSADSVDARALDNAALAGVTVVAAAGNEGAGAYLVGSPSSADSAIAVAALDGSAAAFPGVVLGDTSVSGVNANDAALPVSGTVRVLTDEFGSLAIGCAAEDYASVVPGDIVVTVRGVCARVDRAVLGEAAGAAAVIMVNDDFGLPPFEGAIAGVTIPFVGVDGFDESAVTALDGQLLVLTEGEPVVNETYLAPSDFTSGGPRSGDSAAKPDVTAPGVSILSALVGSGTAGARLTGTSMASPHVAGLVALLAEAHPDWSPAQLKAALMGTAQTAAVVAPDVRLLGTGLVDVRAALSSPLLITTADGRDSASFGVIRSAGGPDGVTVSDELNVTNTSGGPVVYRLDGVYETEDRGTTVSIEPPVVLLGPGESQSLTVSLTAGPSATPPAAVESMLGEVLALQGRVVATELFPTPARTISTLFSGVLLAETSVQAGRAVGGLTVRNTGARDADANLFAWQLASPRLEEDGPGFDLRAAGVQQLPGAALGGSGEDRTVVFAVNTYDEWSNPAQLEVDVLVDTDGDGTEDLIVVSVDFGLVADGVPNGVAATLVFDIANEELVSLPVATYAPMNSSTMLLPVLASALGTTQFAYTVEVYDIVSGEVDAGDNDAGWNVADTPMTTGSYLSLPVGSVAELPISLGRPRDVLGAMIVTFDDAGYGEADLVPIGAAGQAQ